MRKDRFYQLMAVTLFMAACSSTPEAQAEVVIAPQLPPPNELSDTSAMPTPTVTIEPNDYLLTPNAFENRIVGTALASDKETLIEQGLVSQRAFDSTVNLQLGPWFGSGNLVYLFGYPAIITAGHMFTEQEQDPHLVIADPGLTDRSAYLANVFKSAYILDEVDTYKDIGLLVFTDPSVVEYLYGVYPKEKFLTIDDLNFNPIDLGTQMNGVCYPGFLNGKVPYPFFSSPYIGNTLSLYTFDDLPIPSGCSGGGVFDSKGKYTANISRGYDFDQFLYIHPNLRDDAYATPLYSIGGLEGLKSLFDQAINK